jgi:hypothetical protein
VRRALTTMPKSAFFSRAKWATFDAHILHIFQFQYFLSFVSPSRNLAIF